MPGKPFTVSCRKGVVASEYVGFETYLLSPVIIMVMMVVMGVSTPACRAHCYLIC